MAKVTGVEILLDFDGTCVTHQYKGVGKELEGAVSVLKELVQAGQKLILFTMRSERDEGLKDAVSWFIQRGIKLYGVQKNPTQILWTDSPKAYGDLIIDDTALGIPIKYDNEISERAFVDWKEVRKLLVNRGIL